MSRAPGGRDVRSVPEHMREDQTEPRTEQIEDDVTNGVGQGNARVFADETSFPVMCEIGRITISKPGTGEHPIMAAFRMVYEYDSPGAFSFPDGFGGQIQVLVPQRSAL